VAQVAPRLFWVCAAASLAFVSLLRATPAFAGAERAWESLYDARLAQALDGTPKASAMYCQDVIDDLAPTDSLLGQAWYFLGQARAEQGDAQGAADAWERAANASASSNSARALLVRFEQLGDPIDELPKSCSFDEDRCGLHRVWTRSGQPELLPTSEGRILSWSTDVRTASSDALEAVFRSPSTLRNVAFRVRSSAIVSYLRVALDDGPGARFQSSVIQVPTDSWAEVDLPVSSFRAADDGGWSGKARLLRIEDLTGLLSDAQGANQIWIDDLTLR